MVTAATYGKEPIFGSKRRLNLLCEKLLELCAEHEWRLQAWALFPNHYHFVAVSDSPESLRNVIGQLHAATSRAVNALDHLQGRKVWFQFWDTLLTNERSYLSRLHYVHENAVHHGVVRYAPNYPWCSAAWFGRRARPAFRKTVLDFPCDTVRVPDAFDVVVRL